MFGLYYAFAGLLFGYIASRQAKKLGFKNEEWFTAGFALNIGALIILKFLSKSTGAAGR